MNCAFNPPHVAGRTDKGVSAISQVISFSTTRQTKRDVTREDVLTAFRESEACKKGRIVALDCQRVPKMFNARSSAKWRRYVYLFPIERLATSSSFADDGGIIFDVDVDRMDRMLRR